MSDPNEVNGWREWSKHVLAELKRLNDTHDKLTTQLNKIQIEIAMLKVKSGVWGLMGGIIPVFIAFVMYKLNNS